MNVDHNVVYTDAELKKYIADLKKDKTVVPEVINRFLKGTHVVPEDLQEVAGAVLGDRGYALTDNEQLVEWAKGKRQSK